ncbi:hypothetical protein NE237_003029 [Protea cynaroides]|uniref:Uncharacterized protein n=1 Tax=Protea cynaroides TaxID=273540 RepID=A0A9Q0QS75_9MAGN|nr:hypothetical protein NE237_003029 [Protea cynaroides]
MPIYCQKYGIRFVVAVGVQQGTIKMNDGFSGDMIMTGILSGILNNECITGDLCAEDYPVGVSNGFSLVNGVGMLEKETTITRQVNGTAKRGCMPAVVGSSDEGVLGLLLGVGRGCGRAVQDGYLMVPGDDNASRYADDVCQQDSRNHTVDGYGIPETMGDRIHRDLQVEEEAHGPSGNDVDVVALESLESSHFSLSVRDPVMLAKVADRFWPRGGAPGQMEGMPLAMGNGSVLSHVTEGANALSHVGEDFLMVDELQGIHVPTQIRAEMMFGTNELVRSCSPEQKDIKIQVTSREAFKRYNFNYHSTYLLKTLSHPDSMHSLFFIIQHCFQDENGDSESDEDLPDEIICPSSNHSLDIMHP